jgi:hypothetical protein
MAMSERRRRVAASDSRAIDSATMAAVIGDTLASVFAPRRNRRQVNAAYGSTDDALISCTIARRMLKQARHMGGNTCQTHKDLQCVETSARRMEDGQKVTETRASSYPELIKLLVQVLTGEYHDHQLCTVADDASECVADPDNPARTPNSVTESTPAPRFISR